MELLLIAFVAVVAWRLPFVFDYFVLAPFLGTGLGMFGWSLAWLYGADVLHWKSIANSAIVGMFAVVFIIWRCRSSDRP